MKTIVSSLLLVGILARPGGGSLRAAEPAKPLEKGQVLILKNERTMEGDIERVGDRYRVRRAVGETWVPADRTLRLAASLEDAYTYLRSRANLEDADERLRLAKWCRLSGLHSQALAEARAAAELRPDHAETRRFLEHLQQVEQKKVEVKPAAPVGPPPVVEEPPPIEVTTESLSLFVTRVQPILMNTCARCHATGRGGKFHLTQVFGDGIGNRRTLERNLAAVLAQVNLTQPEASVLLAKAVSDHAHAGQAPLRGRQAAPYRTLERWVKLTVENNPHLRDALPSMASPPAPPVAPPAPMPDPRPAVGKSGSEWGAEARPPASPAAPIPPPTVPEPVPVSKPVAASPPPPPAAPADPYDPEVFNRQAHPEA
ncbi:MAG TPA: hypothetical protein VGF59_18060, partial [Bryobacteraceae bacterium]